MPQLLVDNKLLSLKQNVCSEIHLLWCKNKERLFVIYEFNNRFIFMIFGKNIWRLLYWFAYIFILKINQLMLKKEIKRNLMIVNTKTYNKYLWYPFKMLIWILLVVTKNFYISFKLNFVSTTNFLLRFNHSQNQWNIQAALI